MKNDLRQNEIDCLNKVKDAFKRSKFIKNEFDNSDHAIMETILESSRHNQEHNNFPDFFFDGGIIEHFEVTASDETSNGSKYRIQSSTNRKETQKYFRELDKIFLERERHPGTLMSKSRKYTYECFSYSSWPFSFNSL